MRGATASMPVAMQYAHSVMNGRIRVSQWVRKAVARHMEDLRTGSDRGLVFIPEEAQMVIDFFSMLKLYEGQWAGRPFELEPWQQFKLWAMFGWYKFNDDGVPVRRFTTAYCEVPRKNGKTTESGGLGIYLALGDGEVAPQVYFAATKKDQARIGFNAAVEFVKADSGLSRRLGIGKAREPHTIYFHGKPGYIKPLSADSKISGFSVHGGLIDELHEHRDATVLDLLRTGTSARTNPLVSIITTAGAKPAGVCWDMREYAKKVLDGIFEDDSFFATIYTIDEGDDHFHPDSWFKANPNLGVSKKLQYMQEQATMAKNSATYLNAFLRLDLNVWTSAETSWIGDHDWMACHKNFTDDIFKDCDTWGGLDLAPIRDFSSLTLLCKGPDGNYYMRVYHWIPEDNLKEMQSKGLHNYYKWFADGHMFVTPGNVNTFEPIVKFILELQTKYKLKTIAYDQAYATKLANDLTDAGVNMSSYSQSIMSMSPPTKEFEKSVTGHMLYHQADPVTRWMLSNVVIYTDANENVKIKRGDKVGKIDGIISTVMAMGQMMVDTYVPPKYKPYEDPNFQM